MDWKEFKELVNAVPENMDNCPVIMQKDSEGNGYSPLSGIDHECAYVPENSYSGEVYSLNNSADDNCMDEEEWKSVKKKKCIVLFPVN
jgi:hypothetical protein